MKKRLLGLVLALCMVLSLGQALAESNPFPLVTEPLELTMAVWQRSGQVPYNEMLTWQKYEKLTGIHINWIELPDSTFNERRNLMFATGDLPDAIYRAKLTINEINKYASEGLLMPLNDLIDKCAPNLKAFFEKYPAVKEALTLDDGNIYSVGYFNLHPSMKVQIKQFMNKSWLDRLNLNMPATIDELTEVFRAFRDSDANGNGELNDELPLSSDSINSVISSFYGAFGLQNRGPNQPWVDVDETTSALRFWPASDSYRKLLETMRLWYDEKLLDNEIFTMTTEQSVAKGTADKIGMFCAVNMTNVGDKAENYQNLPAALIGPDGDQLYTACKSMIYAPGSFVICEGNEHPEETMKWIDYFYSEEGAELLFMVEKGLLYDTDENGRNYYTDLVTKNPDGLTLTQVISSYTSWSGGNNPAIILDNYFIGGETMPIPLAVAEAMLPYTPKEIWESISFNSAQIEEMTPILNDLTSYVEQMRAEFITGRSSLETGWENYVKTLNDMRMQTYLDIVAEALKK